MGRRTGLPKLLPLEPGKTVYRCRFTVAGVRTIVTTGESDPERALEAAQRLHAEAQLGRPIKRPRRISHADSAALAHLSAKYLAQVAASGKAASYLRKQKMHFRAHFLPRWARLYDITTAAVQRYVAERANERTNRESETVQPVTVYKELVTLSCFLAWCESNVAGYEAPTFDRVKPITSYEAPDFTEEQMRRFLAHLPTRHDHPKHHAVREFFTVQWAQGMRPGEVAKLRWSDVDLGRRRLTIRQRVDKAREKHDRVIGMSEETYRVLSQLAEVDHLSTSFVFGQHDYRQSIDTARRKARLEHVTPHHLRHARLTELASKTQDVAAIQYLAGHKNLTTTDRYVRSRTQRTEALFEAVENSGSRDPKRKPSRRDLVPRGAEKTNLSG